MKYPTLTELNASREMIDVFKGYNHNLRIGEGEFYDMKNLTSAHYPVLSPRSPRGLYVPPGENSETPRNVLGMIAKDALCYVLMNEDGETSTFYINGYPIVFEGNDTLNAEPKTLISMGAYVIIMPDKNYVNTKDRSDKGKIEKTFTDAESIKFELCKSDGTVYKEGEIFQGMKAPTDPTNMMLWLSNSGVSSVLNQYSETNSQWSPIKTYIKISFPGDARNLQDYFAAGDYITISGIKEAIGNLEDIDYVLYSELVALDNLKEAVKVDTNYIVVEGIICRSDDLATINYPRVPDIAFKRQMPEMDTRFVIEAGNRLWGCHYGIAHNGEVVNEIYASKLGDFKNWNIFAGISTDSYVASVGTDGEFTGAITHGGYPIFFKENWMHKIYGNYPANFQIQTTACRGVQKGCHKSLAIVNEVLFYKSRSSICAYDGSLPVEISSALGNVAYADAVAGASGNNYYISMKEANNSIPTHHLFVYDMQKGMWHREDDTQAEGFCNCDGILYYLDSDKQIKTVNGSGLIDKKPVDWMAETGIIGTDSPDKKYISKLTVRLSLEVGTKVYFFIEYDSSGNWEHLFTMSGTSLRSYSVPIRPKRCDHLRLKIVGEGEAKIYSICKTIEQGSDV